MIDEQIYDAAIEECIEAHIRIANLEAIAQALADELMAQDDILDNVIIEYAHALDALADEDWRQTQEDARNSGRP